MSISQEEFEAAVRAAKKDLLMDVTVSGFEVHVAKKSRSGRSRYTLTAVYDPASDSWSGVDPYHGTTLPALARELDRYLPRKARK